ncbi:hypothetical protein BCV72DRAFT_250689 [Rhizopus microsporus var. microsporus]|uniref:DNA-dependent protein kinase catalytic subunit n=1 Tax=Rhizopus microsporus var. microsporus TaxID=86635 RepID=A0A1X0QZS4_RHIZD|nr:hypothetical protein BCV72DRAFT_250689 [Rhizopus microsporus var. microsporus]
MMTMELLKKARLTREEGSESEKDEVYEARLEYNQAAYTVAAAIILRTQKTPKKSEAFYDGFLFREDPGCGIWNNIFDRRKELHLQLVLDQNLEKLKLKEVKANIMYKIEKNTTTHFASSALNGSSFTQPSLSEVILQNSLEPSGAVASLESSNSFDNDMEMTEISLDSNDDDDDFLFEIDVFNENPCMRSLREIIEKLHTLIAPPEEVEPTAMPSWMNRLHKSFTSSNMPLITKLYLAKIIINYPIAFEKYALFWIEHLMDLVTRGEEYGEPLNYFVQDLCMIIIAWGRHTRLPQNRESKHGLFNFITYLIKHVYHETPRVIRSNLYILRSIFSNWSQDIVVPTKLIYDELSYTGDHLTRNMVGLQLVSIILDHGINPYYDGSEVELEGLTELHFYDAISNNLFNKSKKGKSISVAAAEVSIVSLSTDFNNLKIAVIHSLPQYAGVQRTEAVNVITACWKNDPMFLHTLKSSGIIALIMHRDSNTQVAVLNLLNKTFDILTDQDISEIIELMAQACPEHENLECKKLYYSFLKKAFTPPRADRSLQERLRVYIYRGLLDKDRSVSDDIFDYIECTYQLEEDIYKALLKITRNLYTPETEDIYLLYCTQMMLRKAKRSHEYEKPIFENPLPNARFDANYYKFDTSWQKNFSMTPLFVPTQEKMMNAEDIELNIRNTQRSLEFTRTQTLAGSLFSTFNSLQAQEVDANEDQNESILDKYIDSEKMRERATSVRDNYTQVRFIKSKKGAINRYHATRNEELKKKLLYLQSIRKEVQDKKVTLCRSYRVGDLPDIQITYKDLLIPLEVLSSADHSISRLLFSSIVVGVVNENEREEYKEQVAQCITNNLYESSLFFIPTIGSFLRIFFELDITNIESKLIKKVSSKSFNQHIGISLLEKQLLIGDTSEKASKRRKTGSSAQLSGEKSKWIDLSLLFKDIDEPGVFRSIYQSYIATYEIPKKAIDSEVLGDYATAYNQFGQAKESLHNFVDQSEAHLWQEQMLHCYEKLTQWDDIVKDIYAAIPRRDYSKLWESEYQDPYLHYFMRSFTKQRNGITDEEGNEIPWSDENPNPLFSFIEKALKNSNQRQYILRYYSCDVTLASIYQKKYDQGGQLIRKSYESLLTAWTTLHPLAHTSRLAKLADLERTVELEDYIDLAIDIKKRGIDNSKINTFLQALTSRYPDPRIDPIDLWDDIIESRMVFIEDILSLAEEKDLTVDSTKFKIVFLNNIIDAARIQHNFNVFLTRQNKLKKLGAVKEFNLNRIRQYYHEMTRLSKDNPKRVLFMQYALTRAFAYNMPATASVQEIHQAKENIASIYGLIKNEIMDTPTLYEKIMRNENDILYTDCLWKLGKYCDESLSRVGTSSMIQPAVEPIEYSKVVIDSYMKAMDRGHKRAAERFPRILELVELYPEIGSSFVECSENFGSTWLYIRWIPQMVSILDLPIAKYMYPVIKTVAENYPKALYYPFHISYEHYRLVDNKLSEENKKYIEEIRALIRSPIMEEFCTELKRLTNPEHIVKDFIEFLQVLTTIGSIPKAFAQKHGSHLIELMGRNGTKLKNLNRDTLKKLAAYVDDVIMKQKPSSRPGADLLKSYSPWLASFKSSEFEEQLEVPGQYNGLSKPYPELHAKVASIDGRVLVMSSIRKPKRIRIYGTDEKEYLFLVKGGEDLRLDQRIEQVFTVIPMTTSLGLIEWVGDTKPLRACIEEQVDTPVRISHMQDRYRSWMAQKGGKGILGYQKAFSLPREQIAEHYREVSVLVKRTLLRDYLMKLAASPEAFLFLRKDFAHSLACISIFGYILGIGDRHLENFLLDMKSGRLIPIDFGHAFGSATEILPIPEIVPFRLTQQLVGALEPLGISGMLEIAMVNVLEAIQNDKDLLLNIMDIFVKEPLLDWKKAAVKQAKHQKTERGSSVSRENSLAEPSSSSSTTDEIKWYPQKKLEIAKRKLEGDNPVDIVVDELTNGHAKFTYYESACKVAQGERTENIRAKLLGKRCADPKEQVQCLIDLATDPAVLGLMWIGWQSFL